MRQSPTVAQVAKTHPRKKTAAFSNLDKCAAYIGALAVNVMMHQLL
jgi:hypothetical protein